MLLIVFFFFFFFLNLTAIRIEIRREKMKLIVQNFSMKRICSFCCCCCLRIYMVWVFTWL